VSSYQAAAYHPYEQRIRTAVWIDDWFGQHRYGVKFDDSGPVFRPEQVEIPLDKIFVEEKVTQE